MSAVMMPASAPVLQVERLCLHSADGFRLDVGGCTLQPGERIGLIGRNGAGKSTLLDALAGLRMPTLALGRMFGRPLRDLLHEPAMRRHCGVLLQQVEFSAFCKVGELLALHDAMYGTPWPALHRRLGLAEIAPLRARTLSRGQRQRLLLYLALAHRPALALLDEPLTGLDRRYVDALSELLQGAELAQTAMLIIGHTPEELALCDTFFWLHDGRLADAGDAASLLARHLGGWRAAVQAASAPEIDELAQALATSAPALRRIERPQPATLWVFADQLLDALIASHAPAGGWVAVESGRTRLADLLRAGPRAQTCPGALH